MKLLRVAMLLGLALLTVLGGAAHARKSILAQFEEAAASAAEATDTSTVALAGQAEYAFSPRGGCEALVIKTIRAARKDVQMLAYALTSPAIVQALIDAHKRGVQVFVLADHRQNVSDDRSGKGKAALNALATAGVATRTISAYAIHHDKVLVVDGQTTQTGSFNYTQAAQRSNSENVLVLWNNPNLAQGYLKHWERNWKQGNDWRPNF